MLSENRSRVAFGLFEADLEARLLWKAGYRIKLQVQPFRLLTALLEHPGQVVSREELQQRLWGKETTVDFDHSLGIAVNKVREALGDSADNPIFIETLARRGYRFIAPVTHVADSVSSSHSDYMPTERPESMSLVDQASGAREGTTIAPLRKESRSLAHPPDPGLAQITSLPATSGDVALARPKHLWFHSGLLVSTAVLLLALVISLWSFARSSRQANTFPPHIVRVTQAGHFSPSLTNMESLSAIATDGVHLFAPVLDNGRSVLAAISLSGGTEANLSIPPEIASPTLADISPDGSQLLVREHLSPVSEQPLWVVPTLGGPARRVGTVLAHDATWMPDGNAILYASGNDLFLTRLTGNSPERYVPLPGRAFWLRWEPNGHILRFTLIDPIAHTLSLWQLTLSNRKPQQVLSHFSEPASECCGTWTATGDAYVFQSSQGSSTDLWALRGESVEAPVRLTDGPLQFQSPVAARSGDRLYFLGVDARSELDRVTTHGELHPELGLLGSAVRVDYSPDGRWVAWTNTAGELWRAKVDGTDLLQLTPDQLDVFLAHWSPDSSRLAVMGRVPGKAWRLYLVGANGNDLQSLLTEARNAADPSWSPDGQALVFGRLDDLMGKETGARSLSFLNLRTNQVTMVPGSENLFSPRWSPNGRYIAALALDQQSVRLFDVEQRTWRTLPVRSGADPVWSSDSHSLFIHASLDPGQPIIRVSVPQMTVQEIVRLADPRGGDVIDYVFVGLLPNNTPLVRKRVFTGNIFYLDLKQAP